MPKIFEHSMSGLFNKLAIAWNDIQGQCKKVDIKHLKGFDVSDGLNNSPRSPQIVVSLTSYGRRVKEVVSYTLVSLLKQTVKPDRIILWLDDEHWSDDTLPQPLKQLSACGVEIRYCEDLRSYKKLLPALSLCPEDIIITVDDDIYYSPQFIERMYESWLEYPEQIHCIVAHEPLLDEAGRLLPYDRWRKNVKETCSGRLFPVGWGGVLYPPHCLYDAVDNYRLISRLAPAADDIWFWAMALMQGTRHHLVDFKGCKDYSLDAIYQFLHSGSSLACQNVKENGNDRQIEAVCSHYGLYRTAEAEPAD